MESNKIILSLSPLVARPPFTARLEFPLPDSRSSWFSLSLPPPLPPSPLAPSLRPHCVTAKASVGEVPSPAKNSRRSKGLLTHALFAGWLIVCKLDFFFSSFLLRRFFFCLSVLHHPFLLWANDMR